MKEAIDLVPYYLGIAWGALSMSGDERNPELDKECGQQLFLLTPQIFAMLELARRHPEEFHALHVEKEAEACRRYGAAKWEDDVEPIFAMLELARRHPEEFHALHVEKEAEACRRYGAAKWEDDVEPKTAGELLGVLQALANAEEPPP